MGIAGDIYSGGGAKPAKFAAIGDTVEGRVVNVRSAQLEAYGTGQLERWPSGDPKMTPIITVQTTLQEDAEDDGLRDIYARGGVYTALGAGLRAAYASAPSDSELIGAAIKVQHHGTAPSKYGTPRKLYRIRITPSASAATEGAWDAGGEGEGEGEDIPF